MNNDGAIEILFIVVHSHLTLFRITIFVWHPWPRDDTDEGEVKSWGFDQFFARQEPNQKVKLLVVATMKIVVTHCCCHHSSLIDAREKNEEKKIKNWRAFVDGKTFFLVICFFSPQFFDILDTHAWPRLKSLDIVGTHNFLKKKPSCMTLTSKIWTHGNCHKNIRAQTIHFLNGIKLRNSLLVIENIINMETSRNPSP